MGKITRPPRLNIGESVRVRTLAPKLGQHNAEIFGRLGVSEAEINQLCTKGVRPWRFAAAPDFWTVG